MSFLGLLLICLTLNVYGQAHVEVGYTNRFPILDRSIELTFNDEFESSRLVQSIQIYSDRKLCPVNLKRFAIEFENETIDFYDQTYYRDAKNKFNWDPTYGFIALSMEKARPVKNIIFTAASLTSCRMGNGRLKAAFQYEYDPNIATNIEEKKQRFGQMKKANNFSLSSTLIFSSTLRPQKLLELKLLGNGSRNITKPLEISSILVLYKNSTMEEIDFSNSPLELNRAKPNLVTLKNRDNETIELVVVKFTNFSKELETRLRFDFLSVSVWNKPKNENL